MTRNLDITDLGDDFGDRWGYQVPSSDRLRTAFYPQWVRFHSFANLQRYPWSDADIRQALRRHRRVVQDLRREHGHGRLIFIVTGLEPWEALADDGTTYMTFRRPDDVPGLTDWFHAVNPYDSWPAAPRAIVYGSATGTTRRLDQLLRSIILGRRSTLTIADESMAWLYRPYDGGADVVLPTTADRDRLARHHAAWLSPHPKGL